MERPRGRSGGLARACECDSGFRTRGAKTSRSGFDLEASRESCRPIAAFRPTAERRKTAVFHRFLRLDPPFLAENPHFSGFF